MQDHQTTNKVALVIGATGFTGRFLIARLLQDNFQVFAMCRNVVEQAESLQNWLQRNNIDTQSLKCIQGDVTSAHLGLSDEDWQALKNVDYLFNMSALFAWNLSMQQARAVNVDGLVNVLNCVHLHCQLKRAFHLSGYMLTLTQHLQAVGVNLAQIDQTNWDKVYKRLGAYEASKIEGHFTWIKTAERLNINWTVIHPATVIGEEASGEITENQPITDLISKIKHGKMAAIPATPQHYLPVVSLNMLVDSIIHAAQDPHTINQEILIANPAQMSLQQMIISMAEALNVKAPTQFISLLFLKLILKCKYLATRLEMSPESLNFLRTEKLNIEPFLVFNQKWQIPVTDLDKNIRNTTVWVDKNIHL